MRDPGNEVVTDNTIVLLYMKLAVQGKHDDSGDTISVLSFYFEYSGDGALWEYFTANGANKVQS